MKANLGNTGALSLSAQKVSEQTPAESKVINQWGCMYYGREQHGPASSSHSVSFGGITTLARNGVTRVFESILLKRSCLQCSTNSIEILVRTIKTISQSVT